MGCAFAWLFGQKLLHVFRQISPNHNKEKNVGKSRKEAARDFHSQKRLVDRMVIEVKQRKNKGENQDPDYETYLDDFNMRKNMRGDRFNKIITTKERFESQVAERKHKQVVKLTPDFVPTNEGFTRQQLAAKNLTIIRIKRALEVDIDLKDQKYISFMRKGDLLMLSFLGVVKMWTPKFMRQTKIQPSLDVLRAIQTRYKETKSQLLSQEFGFGIYWLIYELLGKKFGLLSCTHYVNWVALRHVGLCLKLNKSRNFKDQLQLIREGIESNPGPFMSHVDYITDFGIAALNHERRHLEYLTNPELIGILKYHRADPNFIPNTTHVWSVLNRRFMDNEFSSTEVIRRIYLILMSIFPAIKNQVHLVYDYVQRLILAGAVVLREAIGSYLNLRKLTIGFGVIVISSMGLCWMLLKHSKYSVPNMPLHTFNQEDYVAHELHPSLFHIHSAHHRLHYYDINEQQVEEHPVKITHTETKTETGLETHEIMEFGEVTGRNVKSAHFKYRLNRGSVTVGSCDVCRCGLIDPTPRGVRTYKQVSLTYLNNALMLITAPQPESCLISKYKVFANDNVSYPWKDRQTYATTNLATIHLLKLHLADLNAMDLLLRV
nr:hypothetical protein [Leuven Tombus-like virus 6]